MSDNERTIDTSELRPEVREPVNVFAENLRGELGENLKSITIVGSSLTEDYRPGRSDINTVLVVEEIERVMLNAIMRMAKSMSRKRVAAPLIMTGDYINRSLDVFAIEFLNLRQVHETIYGDESFSELNIGKKDVRHQLEREFKATLIRLRQGYIASAGRKRLLQDVLSSAGSSMVPLFRALLWLKEEEMPELSKDVFESTAKNFGLDVSSISEARRWRHERPGVSFEQMGEVFDSMYQVMHKMAVTVDELEVS